MAKLHDQAVEERENYLRYVAEQKERDSVRNLRRAAVLLVRALSDPNSWERNLNFSEAKDAVMEGVAEIGGSGELTAIARKLVEASNAEDLDAARAALEDMSSRAKPEQQGV